MGLAIDFALPTFAQQKRTTDQQVSEQLGALSQKYKSAYTDDEAPALAALYILDAAIVMPQGSVYGRDTHHPSFRRSHYMSEKVPTTTSTPTTRILAIGTINPGVDQAKVFEILPNEVRETVNLYLDGKIDQWYSLLDRRGVVFILNVTDPTAAHEMLEKLPLGQAHLMSFELVPLGPLNPLRRLPGMTSKTQ